MSEQSPHVRPLGRATVQHESALGSIRRLTSAEFPLLERISIKRLVLEPGAIREPHWHVQADELTYCLAGEVLVGILDNASSFAQFTISAGEMFHVSSGSLHHIENTGDTAAELIVVFSSAAPEDFSLHAAFGAMSDAVLGNTYGLPAASFAQVPRDLTAPELIAGGGRTSVPAVAVFSDPHKFAVEAEQPTLDYPFGSARLARVQVWPALRRLSMYSLRIATTGMREPHWHPETAELGYVRAGEARMSILAPDGSLDSYRLTAGDVYFVPRAYPHQIEVIGDQDVHFLVFFDQPTPGDIGYRASTSAFSERVLAAVLDTSESLLPDLPLTPVDPLIVERRNALDEPVTSSPR